MLSYGFLLLSLLASSVLADNDWSRPCLDGVCYYDLPNKVEGTGHSGTVKIWGSSSSISDITPAAGWEALECNPDALRQKLRLVCNGSPNCGHLFVDGGALGKVVRLPEHCGKSPFARVKDFRVAKDQHIPDSVLSKIDRRLGMPEVQEIELDINFSAAKKDREGIVHFSLIGTNVPDVPTAGIVKVLAPQGHHWDVGNEQVFPLFSYDNSLTLIDKSLTCDGFTGSLKVVADVDAAFTAVVGVTASGTMVPPRVEHFGAYATLNGEVKGAIDLAASLAGQASTGRITLIEKAVGGIAFPGILEIGPIVSVAASVDAEVGIAAEVLAGINWKLNNATLTLPPAAAPDGKFFHISDAPLRLTIAPNVNASGVVEAHLIPTLALKLEAFSSIGAKVYVDLDIHAKATADVTAHAEAILEPHIPYLTDGSDSVPAVKPKNSVAARGLTYTYGGCLDVDGGIDVSLGADASFFGKFEVDKKHHMYGKEFTIFNVCSRVFYLISSRILMRRVFFEKCFGTRAGETAPRRKSFGSRHTRHGALQAIKRALSCAADMSGVDPVTVIETTVLGSEIEL
ncbi:hypothetical protein BKA70DRAFT_745199 [Coprinopsis sp. MPI-PUGE-AT-0042]|nr:hypothetical protein BKA70DRAFT_745199 [Coprinopsis sp. MPI-PUGE-AT-0042]